MKKHTLTYFSKTPCQTIFYLIILFFISFTSIAQNSTWYENNDNINRITFNNATEGIFTENESNPNPAGNNLNAIVSKYTKEAGATSTATITFDLPNNITNLTDLEINLRGYIENLTDENSSLRLYLVNSSLGTTHAIYQELNFNTAKSWQTFRFDFTDMTFPDSIIKVGGYDQIQIAFAVDDISGLENTYFFDRIVGTYNIQNFNPPTLLSGSWGVRLIVHGGINLDNNPDDYRAGAQQIVDELPSVGHVFTNFTGPANGGLFTLREHPYIDIANEIHPDMVPTIENEQIILDVIKILKDAGKNVIMYLSTSGPSLDKDADIQIAWENYYRNNAQFSGTDEEKEAQAWLLLCRGFAERFDELGIDGYWFDGVPRLAGDMADFSAMFRELDSDILLATNTRTIRFRDDNDFIYVDTDNADEIVGSDEEDGVNDDYHIRKFEADEFLDYTGGHPTPLEHNAPPNSWAYEELTFPDMVAEPYDSWDGKKIAIKHAWIPMRDHWVGPNSNLMFEDEQAYRFIRTLTDAGTSITWGNTMRQGSINGDEMEILREIEARMQQNPKPNYVPYSRPEGAFYVGENTEPTVAKVVNIRKRNDANFAIDGNHGGDNLQNVYLWSSNTSNENQQWLEIDKGDGYYSYQKINTDYCIDGDQDGDNGQSVYLYQCQENNYNQQWKKVLVDGTYYRLEKRNAPSFALDGDNPPAINGTDLYLWTIKENNQNQHWIISEVDEDDISLKIGEESKDLLFVYPNPVKNILYLSENTSFTAIYNMLGEKIMEFAEEKNDLDVSSLRSGIYLLKIKDQTPIKFIKE